MIHGHFARGELVIVRVCLRTDHSIASSEVMESSGDRRFDEMAVTWAQRVRLRQSPADDGRPLASCGAVRVELHDTAEPAVIDGHDDLLG
jgi:outer membrane biosynthesis protein TonB